MDEILTYFSIVVGFVVYVEFMGYITHRFFIHDGIFSDKLRATHYCHHEIKYPYYNFESEKYRLSHDSLPWVLTIIFGGWFPLIILCYFNVINVYLAILLFITSSLHIYVLSYIHDSYHIKDHWLNKYEWYKYNKHCHYIHHLDDMNYGITNYVFDKLFGTFSDKIVDKKDNFNGLKITCEDRYKILDGLPSMTD